MNDMRFVCMICDLNTTITGRKQDIGDIFTQLCSNLGQSHDGETVSKV